MSILGILPAAGKAERFGGIYKELLPINGRDSLLLRAMGSMIMAGARQILIISSPGKISTHVNYLKSLNLLSNWNGLRVNFVVQEEPTGLGDAVKLAIPYMLDINLFAMPDTYYPEDAFMKHGSLYMALGVWLFNTKLPHRFGIKTPEGFVDKPSFPLGTEHLAWGLLAWHKRADMNYTDFTNFININTKQYFYLDYYKDFAYWEDYKDWIKDEKFNPSETLQV